MNHDPQILVMGLPASGKTTFLAALWHVLNEKSGSTSLALTSFSADRTYLNSIMQRWQACEQMARTTIEHEADVVLKLARGQTNFSLTYPDLSGETFQQQLQDRRISETYFALIQNATGILLFVHPRFREPTSLSYLQQVGAVLPNKPSPGPQPGDAGPAGTTRPWSIDLLPSQVALTELLQFVLEYAPNRIRLGVVISAWDIVSGLPTTGTPDVFLARGMPLLHQFLVANADRIEHTVFGVSAQGGDITQEATKRELQNLPEQGDRIAVHQGEAKSHDITLPIAWLLDGVSS